MVTTFWPLVVLWSNPCFVSGPQFCLVHKLMGGNSHFSQWIITDKQMEASTTEMQLVLYLLTFRPQQAFHLNNIIRGAITFLGEILSFVPSLLKCPICK